MAFTTVASFVAMRDGLVAAYTALSTSSVKTYTLGDRMFTYEDRRRILDEIIRLDNLIGVRDATLNCRGANRVDFKTWD